MRRARWPGGYCCSSPTKSLNEPSVSTPSSVFVESESVRDLAATSLIQAVTSEKKNNFDSKSGSFSECAICQCSYTRKEGGSVLFWRKTDPGDVCVFLGFGFPSPNRIRNLGDRPRLVIYLSRGRSLTSLCPIQNCNFASIPAEAIHRPRETLFQMEICGRAGIMSLWGLAMHPKNMCCLVFRALPKLLGLPPSSLKKFQEDGRVHPPLMEAAAGKLPELPQEILMDIFALLEIPDLLRAGSVCSSWCSAYTSLRSLGQYKRLQTPCLLYTSESAGENVACLYSLAEERTYKLTLPEPPIRSRYLIGSSHGWLVTADERSEMHIVNPITGEQIALPSVITIEQVTPIFDDAGAICKYRLSQHTMQGVTDPPVTLALGELRDYLYFKAFVFYDASAGSYIVVLIHAPYEQLSFTRLGDDKWTWLPPHTNFQDCIYKDGLLYAVTSLGKIFAFNLSGAVVTTKIIMDRAKDYSCERIYIVQAPWGDLLQVWRPQLDWLGHDEGADCATFVSNTGWIGIYEVHTAAEKLVEINSLDGHVLFLGNNQSLCLRAEEYPQLKANHVYFTDDAEALTFNCKSGDRLDIGVHNLENNSIEEIVSPQLWSNCRAPVLIKPNPRKMNSALHS